MRENRHKRRWSGGLCAAMVLPILAGCAGNREKEPIHINIWTYYNGDQLIAFNELVEEFNATVGAEKGIFVTNSSVGDINELTANVQDSVMFPVIAAGGVALTAFVAITYYRERLSARQWTGVLLGIVAIVLLNL